MTAPDLRTAAQALADVEPLAVVFGTGDAFGAEIGHRCAVCGAQADDTAEGRARPFPHLISCPWVALTAALAAEATEPPRDSHGFTDDDLPMRPATLLMAIYFPDMPDGADPEQVADELVHILNEERIHNGASGDDLLSVSGIPPAQWATAQGLANLSASAAEGKEPLAEVERLRAAAPASEDDEVLSPEDFEHYRKAPSALYGTAIPPLSEDMRRSAYEQCLAIVRSHEALRTRAGSPPPTPAPTREQVRAAIDIADTAWFKTMDDDGPGHVDTLADAVMALLSTQPPDS